MSCSLDKPTSTSEKPEITNAEQFLQKALSNELKLTRNRGNIISFRPFAQVQNLIPALANALQIDTQTMEAKLNSLPEFFMPNKACGKVVMTSWSPIMTAEFPKNKQAKLQHLIEEEISIPSVYMRYHLFLLWFFLSVNIEECIKA